MNFGAELGVVPGVATVQLGLRHANSGNNVSGVAGVSDGSGNASDNAIMIGATYSIALNIRLEATFSKYSGGMYNSANTIAGNAPLGNRFTMLDLAFGF